MGLGKDVGLWVWVWVWVWVCAYLFVYGQNQSVCVVTDSGGRLVCCPCGAHALHSWVGWLAHHPLQDAGPQARGHHIVGCMVYGMGKANGDGHHVDIEFDGGFDSDCGDGHYIDRRMGLVC
ncbi:hypothetical protein EON63_13205 [archaeon]|nr:MAG: hypothetical protein EON63_13205 [archaeon]